MPPKNESTGKKFDRLFGYIDEIKEDITDLKVGQARMEERLKSAFCNKWTPKQKAAIIVAVITGLFLLAGNLILAFGK